MIAIVNSCTRFVLGHVQLKDGGNLVAAEIFISEGIAREFHTIAVDDGKVATRDLSQL